MEKPSDHNRRLLESFTRIGLPRSVHQEGTVTCTGCGHKNAARMWHVANLETEPFLETQLALGTFNTTVCPKCHQRIDVPVKGMLCWHPSSGLLATLASDDDRLHQIELPKSWAFLTKALRVSVSAREYWHIDEQLVEARSFSFYDATVHQLVTMNRSTLRHRLLDALNERLEWNETFFLGLLGDLGAVPRPRFFQRYCAGVETAAEGVLSALEGKELVMNDAYVGWNPAKLHELTASGG